MEAISGILTAFGISGPAGLNAYLTLLVVGLTARFTDLIRLREPFDLLSNEWVLGVLAVLVVVELFVDKIPGLDSLNDIIGTAVRPAAGAILFAASGNAISDLNPVLGAVLGLLTAGSVHAGKAIVRPPVQVATGGTGGAVLSVIEDVVAVVTVILAIVFPVLALVLFLVVAWLFVRWFRGRRRARRPAPS